MVTAQKHLSVINMRLRNIENSIARLENMLVNERIGVFLGHLTYLQETLRYLREGDWNEEEIRLRAIKLEDIELEARQTMCATKWDAKRFLQEFDSASVGRGFAEEKRELSRLLDDFPSRVRDLLHRSRLRWPLLPA